MSSLLRERITEEMKSAMKAKDIFRLSTIRLILAAIKQKEVDERIEIRDADILAILTKMVKQRQDSITQYTQANRADLAEKEQAELTLIESYLPTPFTADEIAKAIDDAIVATGAKAITDLGKVMGQLKPILQGRADLGKVTGLVKERLGK